MFVKLKLLFLCISLLLFNSCKVNYSLSGASISPDVKTINIKYFPKTATLGPPSLSQVFTEKLKDKFLNQTKLDIINGKADITIEGSITAYFVTPQAILASEDAARNRLTITISVIYTNLKDEKQNFETTFSRFAEYKGTENLPTVEDGLIEEINTQLVDDIFNRAVINW
jgi:hypothetical protein